MHGDPARGLSHKRRLQFLEQEGPQGKTGWVKTLPEDGAMRGRSNPQDG